MSLPVSDTISIYRGDNFSRQYQLATGSSSSSTPIDLTGCTITSDVRLTETTTGSPLVSFTITRDDNTNGKFSLKLSNTTTASLPLGSAVFDIQVVFPDGTVTTYVKGSITVSPDVTRVGG